MNKIYKKGYILYLTLIIKTENKNPQGPLFFLR